MDTDSLYLALSEENLEDLILPEKRNEWEAIRSRDCTDSFSANATGNFSPRACCSTHKKHDKREPGGLFKEEFRCYELLCLCSKAYCCYDCKSNKYKFSSKGLNKRTLEDCGVGPMSKCRKVLEEAVNVTSTNREFRTMKHSVATYTVSKTVAQCRKYPIRYLYTLSRNIPYLYTLSRTIAYLYTLNRTIPYLYTLNRTIPYLNTLSRTIPYLNTLSPNIPYVNTLSRTIPYVNTLNRTIPNLNTLSLNYTLS